MYDAIVVGARVAGAPTAMLLSRRGYRVLLVDRATFPSDSPTGHFIQIHGAARVARWGLLDAIAGTGCPPASTGTLDLGPFALTGTPPPAPESAAGYGPRQSVMSKVFVDAAVAAGAELRERFSVQDFTMDGGRVTGIRGRAAGGALATEQARIVIGADGLHPRLARAVQAPTYHERPALTGA